MTISSLRTAIVYENFIFTQEYAFAERCCFLTFSFEGKFRKYDISVKRKHTKTNENMIFSVLFTNFCETKILFLMQCLFSGIVAAKNFSLKNFLLNYFLTYFFCWRLRSISDPLSNIYDRFFLRKK